MVGRLSKTIIVAVLVALPLWAEAVEDITLLALTRDKAILRIDGARRVLAVGETSPEGVRLVSANTEEATIEVNGKRETLKYGVVIAPTAIGSGAGSTNVTLWADTDGFFYAAGKINGYPVKFLVDTGANTIALNSRAAKSIGLSYKKGRQGVAATAGGMVKMYGVTLNSVTVGEITLYNVPAGVVEGPHPDVPLLGMAFLGRLEMKRDGQKMELIKN